MTFFANIPQATDLISNSQSALLQNNQTINSIFNDSTNGTFSKYVMQNVGVPTGIVTDPTGVWHMLNGVNFFASKPIPYFKNSRGDFAMLPDLKSGTSGAVLTFGFKIGNVIVNYGFGNSSGNNGTDVIMEIPFTSTSTYAAIAGPNNTAVVVEGSWNVFKTGPQTLKIFRGATHTGVIGLSYFAIGT